LFFFRKIKTIPSTTTFNIKGKYFHPEFSEILRISPALKDKFKLFFDSYKCLTDIQKLEFYRKVIKCQNVRYLCEDSSINCSDIKKDTINQLIGDNTLYELMKWLYETIKQKRWGIHDHYQKMYDKMPHKICPFCGIEIMHQTYREDYDHLLAKSIYPLLSINLHNLVPMCKSCNEYAKKEKDILYEENLIRRSCAYPYTTELNITLDFSGSIIPETDMSNPNGKWVLSFNPQNDYNQTWFDVFEIEKRYIQDYLTINDFNNWTDYFIDNLLSSNITINNQLEIQTELTKVAEIYGKHKFKDRNIIKEPLFRYLANCNNSIFYNGLMRAYHQKIKYRQYEYK
jgi:hypothetical protein